MPQITLEIPEIYNYRLEQTAKTQKKTLQEIVVDAIRKFIDAEEKNTDTDSPDALDVLDRLTSTVEAPENWAILHDHYLYGTPGHDGKAGFVPLMAE